MSRKTWVCGALAMVLAAAGQAASLPKGSGAWIYTFNTAPFNATRPDIVGEILAFNARVPCERMIRHPFCYGGGISIAAPSAFDVEYYSDIPFQYYMNLRLQVPDLRVHAILDSGDGAAFRSFTPAAMRNAAFKTMQAITGQPSGLPCGSQFCGDDPAWAVIDGYHVDIEPYYVEHLEYYRELKRLLNAQGKVVSLFLGSQRLTPAAWSSLDFLVMSGYDISNGTPADYASEFSYSLDQFFNGPNGALANGGLAMVGIPASESATENTCGGAAQVQFINGALSAGGLCPYLSDPPSHPNYLGLSVWQMANGIYQCAQAHPGAPVWDALALACLPAGSVPGVCGTATPTPAVTATSTRSPTPLPSATRTPSPTRTRTSTVLPSPTRSATGTPSPTRTRTPAASATHSATWTRTSTPAAPTATRTSSATPSISFTGTGTPSQTRTSTSSPSPSVPTASNTATPAVSPALSGSATVTSTATRTVTPSATGTGSPSPSATADPSLTVPSSPTATLTGTASPSIPTGSSTATPAVSPSATGSATVTPTATPTATSSTTSQPAFTATPTPVLPAGSSTATPSGTSTPGSPPPTTPGTPSPVPGGGPGQVLDAQPYPNPSPHSLRVLLSGPVKELRVRVFTKAMACVAELRGGPFGAGWGRLDLPPGLWDGLPAGTYFLEARGGPGERRAVARAVVLR